MTKLVSTIAKALENVIRAKKEAEALAAINFLISKVPAGGSLDNLISNGALLFHLALCHDLEDVAEKLFANFQNKATLLDAQEVGERSAVWLAAQRGYIQWGLNPSRPYIGLLYDLVEVGKRRVALDDQAPKYWLQADQTGKTPLHCAVLRGSVFGVEFLLGEMLKEPNSIDLVNVDDINNSTPLHLACRPEGVSIIIAKLINAGGDLSHVRDRFQETPFDRLYKHEAIKLRNIYDRLTPAHRRTLSRLYTNKLNQQTTARTPEQLATETHFFSGVQDNEFMLEVDQSAGARYRLANEGSAKIQMLMALFDAANAEFVSESRESYIALNRYIILNAMLIILLSVVSSTILYFVVSKLIHLASSDDSNVDYDNNDLLVMVGGGIITTFAMLGVTSLIGYFFKANSEEHSHIRVPAQLTGYVEQLQWRAMRIKIIHPSRWEALIAPLNEDIIPSLRILERQPLAMYPSTAHILSHLQANVAVANRNMLATEAVNLCDEIKRDLDQLNKTVILNRIPWPVAPPAPPEHAVIELGDEGINESSVLIGEGQPGLSVNYGYGMA